MLNSLLAGLFGFRKSREPFQGELWYVYQTSPDGSSTPLQTADSIESAKAITKSKTMECLNKALALYSPDWVLDEAAFDALIKSPELNNSYSLTDLAELVLSRRTISLEDLKPVGVFDKKASFKDKVSCLTRPYLPLSEDQAGALEAAESDVYETPGGLFVTFGNADVPHNNARFALMPMRQDCISGGSHAIRVI